MSRVPSSISISDSQPFPLITRQRSIQKTLHISIIPVELITAEGHGAIYFTNALLGHLDWESLNSPDYSPSSTWLHHNHPFIIIFDSLHFWNISHPMPSSHHPSIPLLILLSSSLFYQADTAFQLFLLKQPRDQLALRHMYTDQIQEGRDTKSLMYGRQQMFPDIDLFNK